LRFSGEFLDLNRTNIAQGFRSFPYRAFSHVFPALRRLRQWFNTFNNFSHDEILFSSCIADDTQTARLRDAVEMIN